MKKSGFFLFIVFNLIGCGNKYSSQVKGQYLLEEPDNCYLSDLMSTSTHYEVEREFLAITNEEFELYVKIGVKVFERPGVKRPGRQRLVKSETYKSKSRGKIEMTSDTLYFEYFGSDGSSSRKKEGYHYIINKNQMILEGFQTGLLEGPCRKMGKKLVFQRT